MSKLNMFLGVLLVGLVGLTAVQGFASSGIADPTISLERFSPSSGIEMKELTRVSLESLKTSLDATIAYLDAGSGAIVAGGITLASVDNADGTATVTVTVTDAAGAAMRSYLDVWVSDTAFGIPAAQTANLTAGTALLVQQVVANDHLRVLLGTTGIGTLTLTGNDTGHVVIAVGGVLRSVPFTVTTE